MGRSFRTTALLIFFVFAASTANANNFAKSVKSEAAAKADPVKVEVQAAPEPVPAVVKPQADLEPDADIEAQAEVEAVPAPKPAPVAKPEATVKHASSSKPASSDKPYEIQTFDRTMLVCPEDYACVGGSGTDYKCVPDKTASVGGHGAVCKTTLRELPATTEPAQKDSGFFGRKK